MIKIVPLLAGELSHEEDNDAQDGDTACNRQSDDGGTGNTGTGNTERAYLEGRAEICGGTKE